MNSFLKGLKSRAGCVYRGIQQSRKNWDTRIRTRYAFYYEHSRIQENVVLYEAYFGKGMLCNPYAIFQELIKDPKYRKLKHVWVLKNLDGDKLLTERYADCNNVEFVQYGSRKYLKYLCSAKYLINNVTFPSYFTKREGQIYVNTWHGIPLKTLGFDMPNGNIETSNVIRNFLHADYMISASEFLTEIYHKAYKLDGIYQGKIIEEGYPRLDILENSNREEVFAKLRSYGVEVESGKKVILFAPTWRGSSYAEASADVSFYAEFKDIVEQTVDTSKYQILVKVHQRVYELAHDKLADGFYIPSMIDANEVLAVTDILVSDFSSIYFDFLATGKPILFYIPDLESYTQERGLYRSPDCLPGPCSAEPEQIAQWVNNIEEIASQYHEKYEAERAWSNSYHAGTISKKIVDIVFSGNEADYKIRYPKNQKKCILISRGRMLVNGISTSMLSMIDNLDYDKFDVTVMVTSSKKSDERKLIDRINPKARVLCRNSAGCFTWNEHILKVFFERFGYKNIHHPMYVRDVKRSYGMAAFDYVLDFEGYNIYYSILALQHQNALTCVWQHNDMQAERDEKYAWLEEYFKLYQYFDKIVSCAYDVMLVNRTNLGGVYAAEEKFTYVKNFVDIVRLESMSGQASTCTFENEQYILLSDNRNGGCISAKMMPLVPAFDDQGKKNYRFITIGRMSVEKNFEKLVEAFGRLREENANVYLYILGDGKLKKSITSQISKLGLTDCVFTPGNVDNPFAVMKNCDCFILPSLHEGQPMVIHEARGMKMPIIVSNFSSVNGVLIENGQLVIGMEVDDIYEGMSKFIDGEVPSDYEYDMRAYNADAYQEFLKVLEM